MYLIYLIVFITISCRVENFYNVTITKEAKIYSKTDTNSVETNYIQSGESLYMILDSSRKGFRKVKYNNRIGFIYRPSFKAYSPNLTAVNDTAKINREKYP